MFKPLHVPTPLMEDQPKWRTNPCGGTAPPAMYLSMWTKHRQGWQNGLFLHWRDITAAVVLIILVQSECVEIWSRNKQGFANLRSTISRSSVPSRQKDKKEFFCDSRRRELCCSLCFAKSHLHVESAHASRTDCDITQREERDGIDRLERDSTLPLIGPLNSVGSMC